MIIRSGGDTVAIQEAMDKLDEASQELANVGNVTDYIKSNKEKLRKMITRVVQYYSYILNNTETDSIDSVVAYATVYAIGGKNPSLDKIIETILSVEKKEKEEMQETIDTQIEEKKEVSLEPQKPISINRAALTKNITATVKQVNEIHGYDAAQLGEFEWKLEQYKSLLISQKEYYGPYVYQSLLDDVNLALRKVESRNRIIRANPDQSYQSYGRYGLTKVSLLILLTSISSLIILTLGIILTN